MAPQIHVAAPAGTSLPIILVSSCCPRPRRPQSWAWANSWVHLICLYCKLSASKFSSRGAGAAVPFLTCFQLGQPVVHPWELGPISSSCCCPSVSPLALDGWKLLPGFPSHGML